MRRMLAALLLTAAPAMAQEASVDADPRDPAIRAAVETHALPGFAALAGAAAAMDAAAAAEPAGACGGEGLKAAWNAAMDAWVAVSHLRFGPTEVEDRAFALAFWPDVKGFTPKALKRLSTAPQTLETLHESSIAGRGFYAMEFLLYDPDFAALPHRCEILRAQAAEAKTIAAAILAEWEESRGPMLISHDGGAYRDGSEAARELFKALDAGLQFTAEARLGRPLGSFERPRPMRAEARRSGRSMRHVRIALASLEDLAMDLAIRPEVEAELKAAFARARDAADKIDDPDFAGVSDPIRRFRIEALKTDVEAIRDIAGAELGAVLGVDAGFNSLDGD